MGWRWVFGAYGCVPASSMRGVIVEPRNIHKEVHSALVHPSTSVLMIGSLFLQPLDDSVY